VTGSLTSVPELQKGTHRESRADGDRAGAGPASLAGTREAFAALAETTGALVFDEPGSMILAAGFFDKSLARLRHLLGSSGGVIADRLALAGLSLGAWGRNPTKAGSA
jgi:hypothetical protein